MSQSTDLVISNQPGSSARTEINSIFGALGSNHKGPETPSYVTGGMKWIDDTASPWQVYYYDGTNNVLVGEIDTTTHKYRAVGQADAGTLTGLPTVQQIQNGGIVYKETGGSNNAYTFDLGAGLRPSAYAAGQRFFAKLNHSDDGDPVPTLNVTGADGDPLGAKNIKMADGSTPPVGILVDDYHLEFGYDGTNMVILSATFFPKAACDLNMNGKRVYNAGFKQGTDITANTGTVNIDCSTGNYFKITATGNCTLAFTNVPSGAGYAVRLECINFAAYTIAFPSGKTEGGDPLELTASGTDIVDATIDAAGNKFYTVAALDIQ